MHIYTVEEITEADFGCEETGRDKPMAMLKLREDTTSEERYVETSEEILAKQKISEGQKVWWLDVSAHPVRCSSRIVST